MSAGRVDKSDRTIDVFGMLPPEEVAAAPEFLKRRIVDFATGLIRAEKITQLQHGIGADGRRLPRVRPESRPDRATGPPLSPHRVDSRSQKWLRTIPGYKAGTVTVSWSHSWLTILGYHAEGKVRGAPVRNVLEFHPAAQARIENAIQLHWLGLVRSHLMFFLHVNPAFPMPSRLVRAPKPEPIRKPSVAARPDRIVPLQQFTHVEAGPGAGRSRPRPAGRTSTGLRQFR